MRAAVTCEVCHQPTRSATARVRRIGGRCWRKLRPDQRAAIRRDPASVRAVLRQPAPPGDGQLPIDEDQQDPIRTTGSST